MTDTVKRWRELLDAQGTAATDRRCRIPPGATTPGSPPTRGSSAELLPRLRREIRELM